MLIGQNCVVSINYELTNDEPTRDVFALQQPGDTAATVAAAAAAATTAPSDEAAAPVVGAPVPRRSHSMPRCRKMNPESGLLLARRGIDL